MKKLYAMIALAIVSSLSVSAQLARKTAVTKQHTKQMPAATNVVRHITQTNTTNSVIWSDDFSTPANWTIASEAGTIGDWVIGTTGPSGAAAIPVITSATAANGFAIFDSDLICSGNQIGNISTTNSIDLTGHSAVKLEFSQYYARYYDSTYVFVSLDNTNWTKFEVNGALTINQFSGNNQAVNPDIASVDISSVAANQATVWIRFQFYSPSTINILAGCAYAWMIDDVSISDIPSLDAAVLPTAFGGEYTILSLLNTAAFNLSGRVVNAGATTITAGTLTFNVYNTSGLVYSDLASISTTLNSGDTTGVLTSVGSYAPVDTGFYIIEQIAGVSGDGDAGNDTTRAYVYVSDSTNARDYSALFGTRYLGGFGFNTQPGSIGQTYHIYQASQLTSGTFYLDAPTVGETITLSVYSVAAGLPDTIIGATAVYTITADDVTNHTVTLPFITPINVTTGDYFLALDQIGSVNITLGASGDIYTAGKIYYNGGAGWTDVAGVSNLAFMLRLNNPSSTLVGVPTLNQSDVFTVYPNPTKGFVYIMSNGSEGKVTVNVVNTLGKVVKSSIYGSFSNEKIDLSSMAAGTYTIQIISEKGITNKKVVLSSK